LREVLKYIDKKLHRRQADGYLNCWRGWEKNLETSSRH